MLTYHLDKKPDFPLYESLYCCIRDDILNGTIAVNEKLPSKRALANHMHISVTTVENAYSQLILEGYIHPEAGRGFFVNELSVPGRAHESNIVTKSGEYVADRALNEEEEQDSPYVIDFKVNRSSLSLFPFATWSRLMRNILSSQDVELLETVPYNGSYTLRKAIADYLRSYRNMQVSPSQIIIGAGTEYLYSRLLQLLGVDSIFAIEDPGYKKFADISGSQGTLWDYIPIDEQGMRIDRLRKSKANVIHVSPANHFPTGTVMPISRRMELLEWAYEDSSRFIIEDDYDSELRYTGKMIPTMHAIDNRKKVIYMNTFSKSLVPSIRISYMVLPPLLLARYKKSLSFYSCTVSSFEQLTLAKFISEGYFERHINRLKMHYRDRRDQLITAIQESPLSEIARIQEADAGTHFLLKLDTEMSDDQIRQAADDHRIHFAMLSDYEKIHTVKNSRTIVVNYAGLDTEKISQAVSILEEMFLG